MPFQRISQNSHAQQNSDRRRHKSQHSQLRRLIPGQQPEPGQIADKADDDTLKGKADSGFVVELEGQLTLTGYVAPRVASETPDCEGDLALGERTNSRIGGARPRLFKCLGIYRDVSQTDRVHAGAVWSELSCEADLIHFTDSNISFQAALSGLPRYSALALLA